ncbi:CpsD/CapB family tyrosine-protein kinase [Tabrizicola sp.]|uniref:CpsD/CapB family tyrosine-protein kinase n=1 Tax=Tabrizicola sp. TaxID=2005166 RepID=UPI00286C9AE5|nr:CpsD/CapB family tyrosine-protein kinase [Tabrizicola sp.]
MERLQSAIAKARASRQTSPEAPPKAVTKPREPVADAWGGLGALHLDTERLDENRIVALRSGPEAAIFDMMRTNLLHQLREKKWTRVAITSPGSACGKTTISLNLAFSLARQTDLKVIVLEMDLRRPAIQRALSLDRTFNFAGVLNGSERVQDQLLRWGANLAFGLNSFPVPNPAELLSSDSAADAIEALEAQFKPDVILFDMPPMLVRDDTAAFLDQVDCALMVAAAEESSVSDIDLCGKELAAHTNVLGVVLNKCRLMGRENSDRYGAYY